jgi:site-specific DNA recombinase
MRLPRNEHHRKSRGHAEERHLAGTDLHGVTRKLRCAIYTRKSSEEGLDMEFNSLDAQREACQAYIANQRGEGWVEVDDRYDDGGVSGGTLDRPALKRLLSSKADSRPLSSLMICLDDSLSSGTNSSN